MSILGFRKATSRNTQAYTLRVGGARFYISYETIIAAETHEGSFRRHNDWGPTTGRHMNEMDLRYDRYKEVDEDTMSRIIDRAIVHEARANLVRCPACEAATAKAIVEQGLIKGDRE